MIQRSLGENIWAGEWGRLACLSSSAPPPHFEKPLLFIPLALKTFGMRANHLASPAGLGEGDRERTDRWTVGEGGRRAESPLLLPGGSPQLDVGKGWGCQMEKDCQRSSFLVVLCRNPKAGEGVWLTVWDV